MITFQQLFGAGSHTGEGFFTIGSHYKKSVTRLFDIETGIIYGKHSITIVPAFTGIPVDPMHEKVNIVSVPVLVRANFWKYFFINAGALVDIDLTDSQYLDKQNGLGLKLGFGFRYRFEPGFGIFFNPTLVSHSLIPFSGDQYHERLFESGIRLGLSYAL